MLVHAHHDRHLHRLPSSQDRQHDARPIHYRWVTVGAFCQTVRPHGLLPARALPMAVRHEGPATCTTLARMPPGNNPGYDIFRPGGATKLAIALATKRSPRSRSVPAPARERIRPLPASRTTVADGPDVWKCNPIDLSVASVFAQNRVPVRRGARECRFAPMPAVRGASGLPWSTTSRSPPRSLRPTPNSPPDSPRRLSNKRAWHWSGHTELDTL